MRGKMKSIPGLYRQPMLRFARRGGQVLLLVMAASICLNPAWAGDALAPQAYNDDAMLAHLLWTHSTAVLNARAAAATAESEALRAGLYPNPELDTAWSSIPVGRSNPPGLSHPLSNVPNYSAALSELVEIGKRGPRQAATKADVERAAAEAQAALGDRFFALLDRIGAMASSQQRAGVLDEQVRDSQELLNLYRLRASKGEIAVLDADVVEVEHAQAIVTRDAVLSELSAAQAECAGILSLPCPLFASSDSAQAFLESAAAPTLPTQWSEDAEQRRPDLAALAAATNAADQRLVLANRKIIPDVTVRLGYTYDEFIVSGNQRNSLAVGLQIPLPVLDRGQADKAAAAAEAERSRRIRQATLAVAPGIVENAVRRRELLRRRLEHLDSAIEKARSVRESLAAALRAGGTSLIEVLVARRSYQDLVRERVDLDAEGFNTALAVRQALALFPRPEGSENDL